MCGIAGLIHRKGSGEVGREMLSMLQALKHRGPDSTGLALYGNRNGNGEDARMIMRLKLAEQDDLRRGFAIHRAIAERRQTVEARMAERGARIEHAEGATEYAMRY